MRLGIGLVALTLGMSLIGEARAADLSAKAGRTYAVTLDRRMSETTSDESSSGSSTDVDTIIERVLAVRPEGLEIEFDLPATATTEDRASTWQLPARAMLAIAGPPRLLNQAELEARVDPWLKRAKLSRAQCGKGLFTWNYFTVECDVQSAVRLIERFHPSTGDLRENAEFRAPGGLGSTPLRAARANAGAIILTASLRVDPDAIRRERAQTAMTVAALSGKTVTVNAALQEQAGDRISGSIETTFVLDASSALNRRTTVTRIETTRPDGVRATRTVTDVLDRRCVSGCS